MTPPSTTATKPAASTPEPSFWNTTAEIKTNTDGALLSTATAENAGGRTFPYADIKASPAQWCRCQCARAACSDRR